MRTKVFWSRVGIVLMVWAGWGIVNWFPTSFPWDGGVYGHGLVGKWRYDPHYVYTGNVKARPPTTPPEAWVFAGRALFHNLLLGVVLTGVCLGIHELRLRALRPDLFAKEDGKTPAHEEERQRGLDAPGWFVAGFFAVLFFVLAWLTFWTITDWEARPGSSLPEHRTNQGTDLRPVLTVIRHVYPHGGKWGCVACFGVPSLLCAVGSIWGLCRPVRVPRRN